jgi:hypothetical protein
MNKDKYMRIEFRKNGDLLPNQTNYSVASNSKVYKSYCGTIDDEYDDIDVLFISTSGGVDHIEYTLPAKETPNE